MDFPATFSMLNIEKVANRDNFVNCAPCGGINGHEQIYMFRSFWSCLPSHIAKTGCVFKTGYGVSEHIITLYRGRYGQVNRVLQWAQTFIFEPEAPKYPTDRTVQGYGYS